MDRVRLVFQQLLAELDEVRSVAGALASDKERDYKFYQQMLACIENYIAGSDSDTRGVTRHNTDAHKDDRNATHSDNDRSRSPIKLNENSAVNSDHEITLDQDVSSDEEFYRKRRGDQTVRSRTVKATVMKSKQEHKALVISNLPPLTKPDIAPAKSNTESTGKNKNMTKSPSKVNNNDEDKMNNAKNSDIEENVENAKTVDNEIMDTSSAANEQIRTSKIDTTTQNNDLEAEFVKKSRVPPITIRVSNKIFQNLRNTFIERNIDVMSKNTPKGIKIFAKDANDYKVIVRLLRAAKY
ncbi:uncharacterized ENTR1 family protein-like [Stegodyphus dumicola]|uniref:uncharacterized ENTR1 family protein-like n=1 Tax=Stegodyphus dumicola TaxID=202533 RepID=UPI0015AAEE86|nr:uncharacterized ENTR1 family protein-like [Stegodyphus dumicola]